MNMDKTTEFDSKILSSEKIRKTISGVLSSENGMRYNSYLNSCLNCGLCAEACHFYLSMDMNPNLSPVGKIKNTLLKILKNKEISTDSLKSISEIAHVECNLCKRCLIYCPMGIDTSYLITIVRRIIHKLELTPLYIQDTVNSHSVYMNQMWVQEDEWIDTIQWQEDEAQEEFQTLTIPLDKEDSDIMYSVIAPEPKFQASLIYQAAALMHKTKQNWTMTSSIGWDNSDMAMFTGDYEIMGRIKKTHYEAASLLKVKKIVTGECGHAFRSVYDVGNRWLGWKMPPIPVAHAVEFYYDLIKSGSLKIEKKYKKTVTLHDPCNISRGRGLHDKARYVLSKVCENFVEMYPNKVLNYCCSAGGGAINCGPPYKDVRVKSSVMKAKQIFDAKIRGAEILIAPCHNCHSGLKDVIKAFGIKVEIKFLIDILYEVIKN